jgi:hypothetical protein
MNQALRSPGSGRESTAGELEGIGVSGCGEGCSSIGFLHFPPLRYTWVGDAIEFDVA